MKYGRKIPRHLLNEWDLENEEKEVWITKKEADEMKEKSYFFQSIHYKDIETAKYKEIGRIKNIRFFVK